MSALPVSGIIFILTSGGILLGALLRRTLPKHHLNEHARDVVRLGVGLIAAIAALASSGRASCCGRASGAARTMTEAPLAEIADGFVNRERGWRGMLHLAEVATQRLSQTARARAPSRRPWGRGTAAACCNRSPTARSTC